jgi:hypothetical protein
MNHRIITNHTPIARKTPAAASMGLAALLLGVLVMSARAQAQELLKLENRLVSVEIDRTSGAVCSIRDKELTTTYAFAGIGFEVTTATGTVRSAKAQSSDVKGGEAVLRFADGGLEVKLHYTLGAEDRFVEKWLR